MKRIALLAGIAAATIGLAAPAFAEPADDAAFLAGLDGAGLGHRAGAGQTVAAGQAVCQLMDAGVTPVDTVIAVQSTNPGFTLEHAARFAVISANAYCPDHI